MKSIRRIICASMLTLVGTSAMAGEFVVPMNAQRKVAYHLSVNENCSTRGAIVARITTSPSHGSISVKQGSDHPNFVAPNPRTVCNARAVPSTQIWYNPEKNYSGSDQISVTWITPDGSARDETISISVR